MTDLLAGIFAVLGSLIILAGAVAMVRFPDIYGRLSGSSKAGAVGVTGLLVGLVVRDFRLDALFGAILLGAFLIMTLPLAAHVIGRVAYWRGVPPTKGTSPDDLKDYLERKRGVRKGEG